jgi:hypothetical protein
MSQKDLCYRCAVRQLKSVDTILKEWKEAYEIILLSVSIRSCLSNCVSASVIFVRRLLRSPCCLHVLPNFCSEDYEITVLSACMSFPVFVLRIMRSQCCLHVLPNFCSEAFEITLLSACPSQFLFWGLWDHNSVCMPFPIFVRRLLRSPCCLHVLTNFCWVAYEITLLSLCPPIVARQRAVASYYIISLFVCPPSKFYRFLCGPCRIKGK